MSFINWHQNGKVVSLIVNLVSLKVTHYVEGSTDNHVFNAPSGVYCNPKLEKKDYLKLARIYHPDVSPLKNEIATQICQEINSKKDFGSGGRQPNDDWRSQRRDAAKEYYEEWKRQHANYNPYDRRYQSPHESQYKTKAEEYAAYAKRHQDWWNSPEQRKERAEGYINDWLKYRREKAGFDSFRTKAAKELKKNGKAKLDYIVEYLKHQPQKIDLHTVAAFLDWKEVRLTKEQFKVMVKLCKAITDLADYRRGTTECSKKYPTFSQCVLEHAFFLITK
jgi:curved DNA-binding protein CbpA